MKSAQQARQANSAIGYIRVSTDEQADSGLGLAAQRVAIEVAAQRQGLIVVEWHSDEGVSGGKIEGRVGLLAAIEAIRSGYALIVSRRDRLARDTMLACWIEKEVARRRGRIISVAGEGTDNDDPTSMLMRRIIDAFAEYERLLIGLRTQSALRVKMRRGERVSRFVHFGYRETAEGRMEVCPNEKKGIALMLRWRSEGMTFDQIGKGLQEQGIVGRKGQRISPKVVRDIIRREMLI